MRRTAASAGPTPVQVVPGEFDGRNLLTVDVEDYFHANGLAVDPTRWNRLPRRVESNTRRLLELLAEIDAPATFFVLGWVAERHPELVREIHAAGHEVASHGYGHRLAYEQDSIAFRDDVARARAILEDLIGAPVVGYRAPSFSLRSDQTWAFEILHDTGHRYDSSVYPVRGARYGDPDAERRIHHIRLADGRSMLEIPPSCLPVGRRNLPVAGGGYFRFFPGAFTRWAIRRLNERERMPAVVYVHPWEIDPEQPRLPSRRLDGFRHYLNLHRTAARLTALAEHFRFVPIRDLIGAEVAAPALTPAYGSRVMGHAAEGAA